MTEVERARMTVEVLKVLKSDKRLRIIESEIDFAIKECMKVIPTKPLRAEWSPNLCPNCGEDLGGECIDDYYQNPYYEFCPRCRQVLDYEQYD